MADVDAAGRAALGFSLDIGQLPRLDPHATGAERISAINALIDAHNGFITYQVWTDGQNRRMLMGFQQDGWGTDKNWGIKISKPGFDVLVAADADLLFKLSY